MSKYERVNTAIPVNNEWDLEDIDKRAKELGMSRNELILKAIDTFMNFDNDFLEYIKIQANGLHTPEYLVIQNFIITKIADQEARFEVYGETQEMVEGFIFVRDDKGTRVLTGNELKKILKDSKVRKYKNELKELENYK